MTPVFASPTDVVILGAIVLGRLLLPLLIPRFPLPAILGCLVLDGIDQTVLAGLTNIPLDNYQSYDKALDIYYGSIAFISTMRNWRNRPAYIIGAVLYFYRLIGVVLFEAFPPSGARWVLLIFPNTFEFYFIAVEAIGIVWAIQRLSPRFLVWLAVGLWIVVKLPQEYWIHIAQLDMTDTIRDHPWVAFIIAAFIMAVVLVGWFVVRPRAPEIDHPPRLAAPSIATSGLRPVRIRSSLFAVKVIILALLIFIFGSILPGVQLSLGQSTAWVIGLVVLDVSVSSLMCRVWLHRPLLVEFAALTVVNIAFVLGLLIISGRRPSTAPAGWLNFLAPLFFVLLVTLITVLIDTYQPAQNEADANTTAPATLKAKRASL